MTAAARATDATPVDVSQPAPTRSAGLLPWVFPAMLAVGALDVVMGGRDLTESFAQLQVVAESVRHPVVAWVQRLASLLLLLAAVEQIVNHAALRLPVPSPALLAAFIAYWAGSTAAPALFGAHPALSHELLYAPAAGIAACLASVQERDRVLRMARDTLLALMLAGVLAIPLRLHLVMDTSYAEGLLPGVPRFAGLTAHPVTQGLLAQVALLLLWAQPYPRRRANRAAWALSAGVLVIAQSKTAWLAFLWCALAMGAVRQGAALRHRLSDPRRPGAGLATCMAVVAVTIGVSAWVLAGNAAGRIDDFLRSEQGAQLVSMTGRDRIWAAAAAEWRAHPVFGYGLSLWDAAYRMSIGMPNATHAHNQFMDDAARAGTVGAAALTGYALVLASMALRHARATGGLALALFVAIALRAVSEVPLSLLGYGTELFTHLLLLVTLAAAAGARRAARPRLVPAIAGVAA